MAQLLPKASAPTMERPKWRRADPRGEPTPLDRDGDLPASAPWPLLGGG
jgi:hypothetical protein